MNMKWNKTKKYTKGFFIKRFFILFASTAAFFMWYCSSSVPQIRRDATTVAAEGWVFEGWACAPDSAKARQGLSPADYCKKERKKDYLYLKFTARASDRSIQAGSIAMKQSTCRRAARDLTASDGLSKVLGDYLEQASGVQDGQSTGQTIVTQTRGIISGIGLYDCCSINPATGRCADPRRDEPETWEECQCVGYFRYPGGKKAFEAKVKEVAPDQEATDQGADSE